MLCRSAIWETGTQPDPKVEIFRSTIPARVSLCYFSLCPSFWPAPQHNAVLNNNDSGAFPPQCRVEAEVRKGTKGAIRNTRGVAKGSKGSGERAMGKVKKP
ncbi:ADP-L-glycero-D-mannoheptose-6-epimerase [Anopheles sinensis]|uniref:ADP-L-glycero-D-mannoheptose-6-epimerase n=1 Tax=Anopheles sinensis TaxID=74873 RepID=A0A084WQC8_ANOSI|nr:ADP-L-glycero-D-mannoheptose-6-epimerase [Anopheles sinensis]